ncbi:MAG TPA: metallophosphoesterase [Solirubrobacteraceae bacterium]
MDFLLAHLSDPHIGATWAGDRDPVARLEAAVAAVLALRPGAVVVSGDLSENGTDEEYERVRSLLAPLDDAVHVLPGNHDDRARLRHWFGLPGAGDEPIRYAADLGPLRLLALDTTIPGADAGALEGDQLAWLDAELAVAPDRPTVLAMHHTPLLTGLQDFDAFGLAAADREALAGVVRRHPQVRRLVGGHVHIPLTTELGGRTVMTGPSTYVQMGPGPGGIVHTDEPPGFAWHALVGGELVSHAAFVR